MLLLAAQHTHTIVKRTLREGDSKGKERKGLDQHDHGDISGDEDDVWGKTWREKCDEMLSGREDGRT